MVDEGEAAAGRALAVAAAERAGGAADGPDPSTDSEDGPEKNPGASSPPTSQSVAPSDARAGSSSACACTAAATSGASASHGEANTLVAADHQATVAPPIWKVSASEALHSCTLHEHARHRLTPSSHLPALRAMPHRPYRPSTLMIAPLIVLLLWPVSLTLPQALKPYQVEGVRWLYKAIHGGGGLLADDPGLGKTLQVIAVVEAAVRAKQVCRVLVAAPANLLANWDAEFRHWLGGTEYALTVTHLKNCTANLAMPVHLELLARTKLPQQSITLISYEGLLKHGKHLAAGDGVDLLICDEAHGLAHKGKQAAAARSVPAKARLLVTATPLSNDLEELYRLYDLAVPGVLSTLSNFRYDFMKPIEAASAEGADEDAILLGTIAAQALAAISAKVRMRDCTLPSHSDALTTRVSTSVCRHALAACHTPRRCSSDARARHSTAGCPQSTRCSSCAGRRRRSGSWSPSSSQRAPPPRVMCCRHWDASIPLSWIHRCSGLLRSNSMPHARTHTVM